ncbi:MAG: lipid-A-disaccharide synthase [Candidatus Omnitrophica bacterium]|nr:lipid-A-disaccharide synthase [Candidatus Omnitrophota bacterium]MBU1868940.1 lipid-A-disaccharide synthase [Candidatus Omnitrophota bacterium]
MAEKQLLIVCGEASGDLNAANLAREILKSNSNIKIFAVGGPQLAQARAEVFYDIKELSVIGLFDALKKLPKFLGLKKIVLDKIKAVKPDAVIFVDFSGFNLRLAKKINNSLPTIYYISPQVWASRPGRIRTIKKYISKMIVLFKFEEEFYKKFDMDVDCVGHPLLDIAKSTMSQKELTLNLGFYDNKVTIALLPGSRKQEIRKVLPVMLKTASLINKKREAQFVIAKSPQVDWEVYNQMIKDHLPEAKIVEGRTYDCLNIADFALVCSGTATLETAIMQKPFAVVYKMSLLNYLLYRPQVKLPYIGMVNIVAEKEVVPEFIQFSATPKKIADKTLEILSDPKALQQIKNSLAQVKASLGEKGASSRAAKIILDFLK